MKLEQNQYQVQLTVGASSEGDGAIATSQAELLLGELGRSFPDHNLVIRELAVLPEQDQLTVMFSVFAPGMLELLKQVNSKLATFSPFVELLIVLEQLEVSKTEQVSEVTTSQQTESSDIFSRATVITPEILKTAMNSLPDSAQGNSVFRAIEHFFWDDVASGERYLDLGFANLFFAIEEKDPNPFETFKQKLDQLKERYPDEPMYRKKIRDLGPKRFTLLQAALRKIAKIA